MVVEIPWIVQTNFKPYFKHDLFETQIQKDVDVKSNLDLTLHYKGRLKISANLGNLFFFIFIFWQIYLNHNAKRHNHNFLDFSSRDKLCACVQLSSWICVLGKKNKHNKRNYLSLLNQFPIF